MRTHRRLSEAAREWDQAGREPSFLFAGARLAEAREWAESPSGDLSTLELDFLGASIVAERKRRADEVEAARRLAAEAETRRLAEAEHAREVERYAREQADAARRQSRLARNSEGRGRGRLRPRGGLPSTRQYQAIQATADATKQKNKAEENEKVAKAETKKAHREATRAKPCSCSLDPTGYSTRSPSSPCCSPWRPSGCCETVGSMTRIWRTRARRS